MQLGISCQQIAQSAPRKRYWKGSCKFLVKYDHQLGQNRLSVYLDIMNVYDRKNVYLYFWDNDTYSIEALYQFRLLPAAGISFEF
jgi:hypothetical protein